ncbi:MAG: hypothetical protein Q9226_004068 [Calogaya cf. arnoldii]
MSYIDPYYGDENYGPSYDSRDRHGFSRSHFSYGFYDSYWRLRWGGGSGVTFALNIAMTIGLAGILCWTCVSRVRTNATRTIFACFITAISLAILDRIVQWIHWIALEYGSIPPSYAVFVAIFGSLQYLADALLLAAIFTYKIPRSAFARPSTPVTRPNAPMRIHFLLCGLPIAFWFVIMALRTATVHRFIKRYYSDVMYPLVVSRIIEICFDGFYLLVALEICCLAILALTSLQKSKNNASRNDQQSLLFLALVGIPLLVRQVWELTRDIVGISSFTRYTALLKVELARQVFYVLCTTTIYAGLVLLMKNISRKPFSNRNPYGKAKDGGNGLELGTMGPDEPIMRVPAPVEDQTDVAPPEPVEKPVWSSRAAEDHWSPPHYSGR